MMSSDLGPPSLKVAGLELSALLVVLEATDRRGHISAGVEITPDHLTQTHHLTFEIDQSYLPDIIKECAAIVRTYPIRGGVDVAAS